MSDKILPRVFPQHYFYVRGGFITCGPPGSVEYLSLEEHNAILKARDEKLREIRANLLPAKDAYCVRDAIALIDSLLASSNDDRGGK